MKSFTNVWTLILDIMLYLLHTFHKDSRKVNGPQTYSIGIRRCGISVNETTFHQSQNLLQ